VLKQKSQNQGQFKERKSRGQGQGQGRKERVIVVQRMQEIKNYNVNPMVRNWRRWFRINTKVRCVWAHPPFGSLSRRGLNPIKPVYDPDRPDGRLNLTASAFNQLGQYTSSPGRRGYSYAELAVFFPNGGRNRRQYSLHLPTEGWPGWVGLGGWLRSEIVYIPEGSHPSPY